MEFYFAWRSQPGTKQRSEGQPRPQSNPHTPGATHACNAPHPIAHCTRPCQQRQHGECDTRVRTPVRGTHARALAKRIATTCRASLVSRVSNAAVVAAVRAAAPALAPLAARPRPAAASAPEAPLVHVRRKPTAAHSACVATQGKLCGPYSRSPCALSHGGDRVVRTRTLYTSVERVWMRRLVL